MSELNTPDSTIGSSGVSDTSQANTTATNATTNTHTNTHPPANRYMFQTSNTASHQHQQEQELLSGFSVPNPPVSTQQSSAAERQTHIGDYTSLISNDAPRTLWMGDLDPWLDEAAIAGLWWQILQKRVGVKIIKPKTVKPDFNYGGLTHSGYCFIEFDSFDDAQQALTLNGQLLPDIAMPSQQHLPKNPDNQKKYFRLNWASGATLSAPIVQTPEYSLFVGDLSASTTEAHLLAFFQKKFPSSIKTVRVMTDPVSGKSRCFGFVRFTNDDDRQRALVEMNGAWFGGRPMRVALATPRNSRRNDMMMPYGYFLRPMTPGGQEEAGPHADPMMSMPGPMLGPMGPPTGPSTGPLPILDGGPSPVGGPNPGAGPSPGSMNSFQAFNDPSNTTVFVGGLSSEVSEQTLFTLFKPFGIIQQVKIPPGKNCGFIKYTSREEAEEAISSMQGFIIGGNRIRLSWGRVSMNNKKFHQQHQQVAQAAQYQAAAALSMGMDAASAIAAAAAAAGGYPGPNMGPNMGNMGPGPNMANMGPPPNMGNLAPNMSMPPPMHMSMPPSMGPSMVPPMGTMGSLGPPMSPVPPIQMPVSPMLVPVPERNENYPPEYPPDLVHSMANMKIEEKDE